MTLTGAKPAAPVPAGFVADASGALVIAGRTAQHWVAAHDTPLFVLDAGLVRQTIAAWRAALPTQVRLFYAVKANPLPALLRWLAPLFDGFDAASAGELARLDAAGIVGARISLAGPGKRLADHATALTAGALISVESRAEAERLCDLAASSGHTPRVALRVNPDFAVRGAGLTMGGGAQPFGIEVAEAPAVARWLAAQGVDLAGWHVHAATRLRDTAAVIALHRASLGLIDRLAATSGLGLRWANLGGGLGAVCHHGDMPLDRAAIGAALGEALAGLGSDWAATRVVLEPGRALVAEAGVYLTRVIERKVSAGTTFVICDGGLHHVLAASGQFGSVVRRNHPLSLAHCHHAAPHEVVTVVGCLCTPLDRLAERVALPHAAAGDVVALFCTGAYGASASPSAFLSHGPAAEILAENGVELAGAGERGLS